jgi:predicted dehydrogenase
MDPVRRIPRDMPGPARRGGRPSVALVGISGYGRVYLRWLEAMVARRRLRLAAAVVINPDEEREACERLRALGVKLYRDWHELEALAGCLDLCLIPTPIHLHAEITIAALELGANVLVEKPLAASVEQARAIQAAEARTGRWVAVGYQDFYAPSTLEIARQLAAGRIGRIRSVRWLGLWPRTEEYYRRNHWAGRKSLDGRLVRDSPLNNAMAHYLNLALFWAGAGRNLPVRLERTEAELFRCYPIENFDTAVARFHTSDGVMIQAAVSHCCEENRPIQIRVLGDEGRMIWTHRGDAIWYAEGCEPERVDLSDDEVNVMFSSVLARLRNADSNICMPSMALPQVEAIEALPKDVRDIAPAWLEPSSHGGEARLTVRGISADLEACLARGALPTELGLAWAGSASMLAA